MVSAAVNFLIGMPARPARRLPNARYWVNHRHDRSKKGFIPVA
jgi:hypothetical protein